MGFTRSKECSRYCYRLLRNGFKIQWGNVINSASYPIPFTSKVIPLLRPYSTTGDSSVSIFIAYSRLSGFDVKIKWGADYSTSPNTIEVEWIAFGY